jgi:hypothetical protein
MVIFWSGIYRFTAELVVTLPAAQTEFNKTETSILSQKQRGKEIS